MSSKEKKSQVRSYDDRMSYLVNARRKGNEDLSDEEDDEDSFDPRTALENSDQGHTYQDGYAKVSTGEAGQNDNEPPRSFTDGISSSLASAGEFLSVQSSIPNFYASKVYSTNARKRMNARQRKLTSGSKKPALYTAHSMDVVRPSYGEGSSVQMSPSKEWGIRDPESGSFSSGIKRGEEEEDVVDYEENLMGDVDRKKSNFTQSLFNAINVLMGIGLLGFPYAMLVSGIVPALIISTLCAVLTNYTAKVLGHCLDSRPGLNTYSDIGDAAFGNSGRLFISIVFFFELIVGCIALIILAGDTLASLFPDFSEVYLKIIVFIVVLPMTFLKNLSYLAFASFFGILATTLLIVVMVLIGCGVLSDDVPGSGNLMHPEGVQLIADPVYALPLSFGLIMSGYAGHSVFPSIYREMATPRDYPKLVDCSYIAVFISYTVTMVVGYLMYGMAVSSEVQKNFLGGDTQGASAAVILLVEWLIVIIPITKYALLANPVNMTVENIAFGEIKPSDLTAKQEIMRLGIRTGMGVVVLLVAIVYPDFESVMAFLGAFFSFTVSVLFPIACALKLFKDVSPSKLAGATESATPSLPTERSDQSGYIPSDFSFTTFSRYVNYVVLFLSFLTAFVGTVWALLNGIGIWNFPDPEEFLTSMSPAPSPFV